MIEYNLNKKKKEKKHLSGAKSGLLDVCGSCTDISLTVLGNCETDAIERLLVLRDHVIISQVTCLTS